MKCPECEEDRPQAFPTQVKYDEKYDVLSVTFAHSDNTYGDDNYDHGLMVWRDIESDKALGFRISGISKKIKSEGKRMKCPECEKEINALKALNAELAAAKDDIKTMSAADDAIVCTLCKYRDTRFNEEPCMNCLASGPSCFEWRGHCPAAVNGRDEE